MAELSELAVDTVYDWLMENENTSHWAASDISGVSLIQSIIHAGLTTSEEIKEFLEKQ